MLGGNYINLIKNTIELYHALNFLQNKTTQIKPLNSTYVNFGADNRTCSERSERNSGTGEFIRKSGAPAAQRAGANKCNAVCRQNAVLFQVRCRMKKGNPFGLPFLVRTTGLEPAQPCGHKNLNLTRLPIPPCPHNGKNNIVKGA